MRFALYTNSISPHQLPLARELVKTLGADSYRYVHMEELSHGRAELGWKVEHEPWLLKHDAEEAKEWLRDADVVMMQHPRDWDLFEDRLKRGKACLYASERWFKPISLVGKIKSGSCALEADGRLRMMFPAYRRMARRFVELAREYDNFKVLSVGVWAKRDFLWLGLPEDRLVDWGYFVERSLVGTRQSPVDGGRMRILWVGRMIGWKRVDTLVRAFAAAAKTRDMALTLVGSGPERKPLGRLAKRLGVEGRVKFIPNVPIDEVRTLMRQNDVYVLSSDGQEGWGAALSEALAEGMEVLGTLEAGSSATILPAERLYHAGDYNALAEKIVNVEKLPKAEFRPWTVEAAAEKVLGLVKRDLE